MCIIKKESNKNKNKCCQYLCCEDKATLKVSIKEIRTEYFCNKCYETIKRDLKVKKEKIKELEKAGFSERQAQLIVDYIDDYRYINAEAMYNYAWKHCKDVTIEGVEDKFDGVEILLSHETWNNTPLVL